MMRFRLNNIGDFLDVLEDTSVQIVSKNQIYGIDEVELQRTTELRIPATPHNEELLRLANDYHGRRDMLRGAIPSQMILGIVTYDGVLYINSYDFEKECYNGVFVYGQMTGLQAIKRLGKLSDWDWSDVDDYIDSNSPTLAAPYAKANAIRWGRVLYAATEINGSISLTKLLDLINTKTTVRIIYPSGLDGVRIIKGKMQSIDTTTFDNSVLNEDAGSQPSETPPTNPYNKIDFDSDYFTRVLNSNFGLITVFGGVTSQRYWTIAGLKARFAMSVQLPEEFGEGWFMMRNGYGGSAAFYGGYWFEDGDPAVNPIIIHGEPLRNKIVQLNDGDEFYFVNVNDYVNGAERQGWMFSPNTYPHNFNLRIMSDSRYYLRDNMPDVTLMDLIKTVAAITGTAISLNKLQTVVRFTPLDGEWEYKTLDRIIARKTLECAFKDYAQSNVIKFADDADNEKPIRAAYNIQNTNLQAEKDLYVIPFAAGVEREAGSSLAVGMDGEKDVIADTIDNVNYLQRMTVKKNSVIEAICERANKLQVTCRMSALEYYGIKPQTLFKTLGLRWTWTDLQWQKETATMTLQEYEEPIQPRWYPIIQGDRTLDDMIAQYGDLMQTFENAPDVYGTEPYGGVKKGAMALERNIASVQIGRTGTSTVIIYEDGEETARYYRSTKTHTFNSTTSAKHIVFYTATTVGSQNNYFPARWMILPHVENFAYNWVNVICRLTYLHIEKGYNVRFDGFGDSMYTTSVYGYEGSVYYLPDWWTGTLTFLRWANISKLRLSKGTKFFNNGQAYYYFGVNASGLPNLTDIYVHWGLGEVITQPANRYTGPWKLHIPNLGNDDLNAALVAEYRSKGWNYVSGRGIFNDVEETEPRERIQ